MLLDPRGGFLLRGAADFPDHDDPVRLGILMERLNDVEMRRAVDRVAAYAHAGGLADAAAGQLPDRLISERAASRHDADVALLVDVTR
jgi:hypothetical protein